MNSPFLQQKQFVLLPAITFKVKSCLIRAKSNPEWGARRFPEIAKEVRAAIVPLLRVFDFQSDVITTLEPEIEQSILMALKSAFTPLPRPW